MNADVRHACQARGKPGIFLRCGAPATHKQAYGAYLCDRCAREYKWHGKSVRRLPNNMLSVSGERRETNEQH